MSVRVGFSTPSWWNPVSALVRWVTGSTVSHAFFLVWDEALAQDIVVEAHELGFRAHPWRRFRRFNRVLALYLPRRPLDVAFRLQVQAHLGDGYDFGGLVGGALVKLGQWLKLKWRNRWASKDRLFCSESVAEVIKATPGYEDFAFVPEEVTPEQLWRYFGRDGSKLEG